MLRVDELFGTSPLMLQDTVVANNNNSYTSTNQLNTLKLTPPSIIDQISKKLNGCYYNKVLLCTLSILLLVWSLICIFELDWIDSRH